MRFRLIDQIVEQSETHLIAIKNVTLAEEYLADHFPGFPILPGVMMLETLVQAARALLEPASVARFGSPGPNLVLAETSHLKYGSMVRPGETLRVEVAIRKESPNGWDLTGTGTVHDKVAVKGRFSMVPLGQFLSASIVHP